jgi:hypothetical protein
LSLPSLFSFQFVRSVPLARLPCAANHINRHYSKDADDVNNTRGLSFSSGSAGDDTSGNVNPGDEKNGRNSSPNAQRRRRLWQGLLCRHRHQERQHQKHTRHQQRHRHQQHQQHRHQQHARHQQRHQHQQCHRHHWQRHQRHWHGIVTTGSGTSDIVTGSGTDTSSMPATDTTGSGTSGIGTASSPAAAATPLTPAASSPAAAATPAVCPPPTPLAASPAAAATPLTPVASSPAAAATPAICPPPTPLAAAPAALARHRHDSAA